MARKWHDPTPCRVRIQRRASPGVDRHFNHPENLHATEPRSLSLARTHRSSYTTLRLTHPRSINRYRRTAFITGSTAQPRPRNQPPTTCHRLAGSASGTGRSSGSLLDEAAATLDWSPDVNYRDPERLKEVARQYRERTARALALEEAALELNEAVRRAATVRRRIERRQETQRRRAERGTTKKPRRPSRPVKVDVDPEAWEAVKRDGVRRRRPVGAVVGELVRLAVQDGVVPRNRPQQKSAQDPAGTQQTQQSSAQSDCAAALCKGRIFARLFVDEETWAQFRVLAL